MAVLLLSSSSVLAQTSTTQTVTIEVKEINELSFSGDPSPLVVDAATAGSQPDPVTENSTTFALTTNASSKKITGSVGTSMPSGVTLEVQLNAPSGASSAGKVGLSTTDQDLVTSIAQVAESSLTTEYTLSATVDAGTVPSTDKTVTFTFTTQ